jgi:hypothetical protein
MFGHLYAAKPWKATGLCRRISLRPFCASQQTQSLEHQVYDFKDWVSNPVIPIPVV